MFKNSSVSHLPATFSHLSRRCTLKPTWKTSPHEFFTQTYVFSTFFSKKISKSSGWNENPLRYVRTLIHISLHAPVNALVCGHTPSERTTQGTGVKNFSRRVDALLCATWTRLRVTVWKNLPSLSEPWLPNSEMSFRDEDSMFSKRGLVSQLHKHKTVLRSLKNAWTGLERCLLPQFPQLFTSWRAVSPNVKRVCFSERMTVIFRFCTWWETTVFSVTEASDTFLEVRNVFFVKKWP